MKQGRPTVVVVGAGLARNPDGFDLRLFGHEPHGTYNRILLSTVLGGETDPARLWINTLDWYRGKGVLVHSGVRAEMIDPQRRTVTGAGGKVVEPYDVLVLATGSRPFLPPIPNARLEGVF